MILLEHRKIFLLFNPLCNERDIHKKNFEKDFAVGNCYDCGANFCIQTWSGARKLCMDTVNVFLLYL